MLLPATPCQEIRQKLQSSLNAEGITLSIKLKGLNRNHTKEHRFPLFFQSIEEARIARISDRRITTSYAKARLYTGTTYPIKVHRVKTQEVIENGTGKVKDNIKESVSKENVGVKITEIQCLSTVDERKRYGSMVVRLAEKETSDSILQQSLIEVEGKSHIVNEWKIQSSAHKRCFKCQAFVHQAAGFARRTVCGNCAEEGHSHKECTNKNILYASCKGKHMANDKNCIAKANAFAFHHDGFKVNKHKVRARSDKNPATWATPLDMRDLSTSLDIGDHSSLSTSEFQAQMSSIYD